METPPLTPRDPSAPEVRAPFDSLPTRISVFYGPDGLRAGWSLLLYAVLLVAILMLVSVEMRWFARSLHPAFTGRRAHEFHPLPVIAQEAATLLAVILATFTMARIERRRTASYGLAGTGRVRQFAIGLGSGFAFLSLLVGILVATGRLELHLTHAPPSRTLAYAAVWGLCFLLVGMTEEWMVRGYPLFRLSRAIHFWPAAIVLAVAFGLMHWGNHGESPFGLVAAGLIALVFSLSLWRLGHLWWAIGFHASWDWAESFFYGTPDSGTVSVGRLMHAHPMGPVLLSGGATGPEGSVWIVPVILLVALFVWWTQSRPKTDPPDRSNIGKSRAPEDPLTIQPSI